MDPSELSSYAGLAALTLLTVNALLGLLRCTPERRNDQIGPSVISKITPERMRDRFQAANAYDARIDTDVLTHYKISPDKLGAAEPSAAFALNEDMAEREPISLFSDVRVPVLVLGGAQDPIIPLKRAEMMHRMIPQSRTSYGVGQLGSTQPKEDLCPSICACNEICRVESASGLLRRRCRRCMPSSARGWRSSSETSPIWEKNGIWKTRSGRTSGNTHMASRYRTRACKAAPTAALRDLLERRFASSQ